MNHLPIERNQIERLAQEQPLGGLVLNQPGGQDILPQYTVSTNENERLFSEPLC